MDFHEVNALVFEWENGGHPSCIGYEIASTGNYPVIEDLYGDEGEVLEFEAFDQNWLVVIHDNIVKEVVGQGDVCPDVATFAKAVVVYMYRFEDRKIDMSYLSEIIMG
jgi:hypothetical protein